MTDRVPSTSQWRRAQTTVRGLRDELRAIGIPEDAVRRILPMGDIGDGEHVRLGTWPVDAAERLLAALTGRPLPEPAR